MRYFEVLKSTPARKCSGAPLARDQHAVMNRIVDLAEQIDIEEPQQNRAEDHAGDAAQPAQHYHNQDSDGDVEAEILRGNGCRERRVHHAADAAHRRAEAEGQQLGAHQVDAGRRRRRLIFANGDPRATQARVAE